MHRFSSFAAALFGAWFCLVPVSPASAAILITIDKATQQMTVEVDGTTRWTWPVSTGRRSYETPTGSFKPFRLEEDHYSKEWDEAPMPYSIFFTAGGHAIHGSYEIRRLGSRASHGCVRLAPKNAAKLFALVQRQGLSNTRVMVLGDPNAPVMAKRSTPKPKVQEARRAAPKPAASATAQAAATVPATAAEQAFGYAPAQPGADVTTTASTPPLQREPPTLNQ